MKKMAVGLMLLALVGCTNSSDRDNVVAVSTNFGAIAAGFIGYELIGSGTGRWFSAAILGAGGAAGAYYAAQKLLPDDRAQMNKAGYESLATLPIGETSEWSNPETGNSGSFTPTRAFLSQDGQPCREVTAVLSVEGEEYETRRTVCQKAEGTWVTT